MKQKIKQKSLANLQKWPKGTSGNPAGRKPGSKNVSTIVRELLEQDVANGVLGGIPLSKSVKGKSTSYAQAMVLVMIQKALEGDVRAVRWLADREDRSYILDDPKSFFSKSELVIKVVKSEESTVS